MKNLTLYNECNEREINSMVVKAMCAWANWKQLVESKDEFIEKNGEDYFYIMRLAHFTEYEATCRCIEMFVKENAYRIQTVVIDNAKETFNI